MEKLVQLVFLAFIGFVLGTIFGLWGTYVTMHLWNWFVVPTTNLHPIGFFLMWGLMIFVHAFKGYKIPDSSNNEFDFGETIGKIINIQLTYAFCYTFALFCGYIVHTLSHVTVN